MSAERIPIASDHAGFELKEELVKVLHDRGFEVDDKGTHSTASTDYPDYARKVAEDVASGSAQRGVLLCGSGVGMDIVANRYRGVRAALAWKSEIAALSRQHNNSNVLVLPARFVSTAEGIEALNAWLDTEFDGGRHGHRVEKIDTKEGA